MSTTGIRISSCSKALEGEVLVSSAFIEDIRSRGSVAESRDEKRIGVPKGWLNFKQNIGWCFF
jgi:hypothetical protein